MSAESMLALFGLLLVMAAAPSVSALLVTSRAAALGFGHGLAVAGGIVLGDLLFLWLAIFGLALLITTLGPLFVLLELAGALYLLWLGRALWRAAGPVAPAGDAAASLGSSLLSGLLLTLADQKAVLFYLGLLPAFVDLVTLSVADVACLTVLTAVAVGTAKIAYAWAASRAGLHRRGGTGRNLQRLAAAVLLAAAAALLVRLLLNNA